MKLNKKDIIIIILIVLIVATSIAILLTGVEKKPSGDIKEYNIIDISDCVDKKCNEKYDFNDNVLSITEDETHSYQLRINGKVVLSRTNSFDLYPKIYTFGNNVMITVDNKNETILSYIYNIEDEKLEAIEFESDITMYNKNFEVKDNLITYYTSGFSTGDTYEDIESHLSVNINNCLNYGKYKDKVVARTYEIKYENGKMGTPVKKEDVLLKDYKQYSKLCK